MPFDATPRRAAAPPTTTTTATADAPRRPTRPRSACTAEQAPAFAAVLSDRSAAWDAVLRLRAGNDRRARAAARSALRAAAHSLDASRSEHDPVARESVIGLLLARRRPPGLHPRRPWARAVIVAAVSDADRRNNDAALRAAASVLAPAAPAAVGPLAAAVAREAGRREASLRRGLERLLAANAGLVHGAVGRHLRGRDGVQSLGYDDLAQEATLGLLRGLRTFDPSRGWSVSTYVLPWIRQAIHRAVADQASVVRAPVHLCETMVLVSAARRVLGDDATAEALAAHTGRLASTVRLALAEYPTTFSADAPAPSGRGRGEHDGVQATRVDRLPDPYPWDYVESIAERQMRDLVDREIEALPPQSSAVLRRRYLSGEAVPSLASVGEEMGVSRERVRQVEVHALGVLRRRLTDAEAGR